MTPFLNWYSNSEEESFWLVGWFDYRFCGSSFFLFQLFLVLSLHLLFGTFCLSKISTCISSFVFFWLVSRVSFLHSQIIYWFWFPKHWWLPSLLLFRRSISDRVRFRNSSSQVRLWSTFSHRFPGLRFDYLLNFLPKFGIGLL